MSPSTSANAPISPEDFKQLMSMMEQLVALLNPLTALLNGASGMASGAGQRLEELIQQLTSVSTGLSQASDSMTVIFGPDGAFKRQEDRMLNLETMVKVLVNQNDETAAAIRDLKSWLAGSA